ncbi:DUF4347 domain-containing protein [Nostoc sp. C117]|uniref:DUF4347 domain-containing protein n=1 Tax=Nostoc sp. C117 TaxID=3349875 RepID=UPI00370D0C66
MSFDLRRLATSSTDVLSTTSLAPVWNKANLTTSFTELGRSSQSLLFVDGSVADYQQLVAGVIPGNEIHVLDPVQDAVTQITNTLLGRQNITSLHIVSHGEAGGLDFGSSALNLTDLPQYVAQLKTWNTALTKDADILLYGCNVGEGELGQAFVQKIGQVIGANVAASNNLTGKDGDWNLEVTTGKIESPLVFDPKVTSAYAHDLNILGESFKGSDVANPSWIYNTTGTQPFLTARSTTAASTGGIPGGGSDPVDSGALRLTSAAQNQASFVLYNRPINASNGLSITFNIDAYGGNGADGISFFLIDGNANPTQAGARGGALGYSSNGFTPGLVGGYLGVGFDEFGNFSNPLYGADGPGAVADSIAVHGSQANSYKYLAGTGTLLPGIDNTSGNRATAQKKVQIDLTPTGLLSVKIDLNNDGDFSDTNETPVALQNYNVVANNGALPSTFKFGFAASTGQKTNIHEITGLDVDTFGGVPYTPLVNFTSNSGSVSEGAASLNLTAQIDVITSNTVTVPVTVSGTAADGTDYTLSNSFITILPGQLTGSITLNPIDNLVVGSNKTAVVTMGTPMGAQLSLQNNVFTATIVDDDSSLSVSPTEENTIWEMNGFALKKDYSLPTLTESGWQVLSTADFNSDGTPDILGRNKATGKNAILQMNNDFTPNTVHFITQIADLNWQIVSTADFNRDGTPDILWRNKANGENTIWEMNNDFTLKTDHSIAQIPDPNWEIVSTGDFNGDRTPDILWRNKANGENTIWEMNNDFTLKTDHSIAQIPDPNWEIVSTADFNGDGTPDILWRNKVSGENTIWEMKNDFTLETGHFITQIPDPNWEIVSTGDFNGDGTPDILWRNKVSGENTIWEMKDDFTLTTGHFITQIPDPNWQIVSTGDFNSDGTSDILWRKMPTVKKDSSIALS